MDVGPTDLVRPLVALIEDRVAVAAVSPALPRLRREDADDLQHAHRRHADDVDVARLTAGGKDVVFIHFAGRHVRLQRRLDVGLLQAARLHQIRERRGRAERARGRFFAPDVVLVAAAGDDRGRETGGDDRRSDEGVNAHVLASLRVRGGSSAVARPRAIDEPPRASQSCEPHVGTWRARGSTRRSRSCPSFV